MTRTSASPIHVLVTGVGAIIGQGIVRSLRASSHSVKIIGLDRSARPPGPEWCDVFIQKPTCDERSDEYLDFWQNLIRKENIDLVLPGLEVDMLFLDEQRAVFEKEHDACVLALNHSALIALTGDKWLMHLFLVDHGISAIPTVIDAGWDGALATLGAAPILLKPRQGNGSRGIVRLHDREDFVYWSRKTEDPWMLQRIVGSEAEEYTVGSFGLGDGRAVAPIIMRRRLSGAGNTQQAEVVDHPLLQERVTAFNTLLKPIGPTNYQFRVQDDEAYLLEVNPRFSSSNSLRTGFGYNEAQMAVEYFVLNRLPQEPDVRPGVGWRYSEDYIVYDRDPV
ncbi:ATP-grasp domain-containing protein [Castellaniella sp.]|uniref:ATP-grasp domain-containing protein n=1 Tax=Castellaniella sp. TaxID=1955812 RepID=UPI003C73EAA1